MGTPADPVKPGDTPPPGRARAGALAPALARFGGVGAFCAGLNIAIIWVGTVALGLHYAWAALGTCAITIPLSYVLHRAVSFRVAAPAGGAEFARFVAAQLSQFGIGFVLMAALVETAGWRPWVAMAAVTAAMFAYGFLAQSSWVFRGWRTPPGAPGPGPRPLQVLQVSAFFPAHGGGIEVVAGELARRLAGPQCALTWMAGGAAEEAPAGAVPAGLGIDRAEGIDLLEKRLGLPAPLWSPRALARLWRRVGAADLVHVHDYLYLPTLAAVAFARLRGRPVLLTQHIGPIPFDSPRARGVLHLLNHTLGRVVLGTADQVVFVGEPVRAYFERFVRFRRVPRLVSNGVDHRRYHPRAQAPAEAGDAAAGPLRALFVGRFVEKKGLALLRECAALPGIHWTFVGRGPLDPRDGPPPPAGLSCPGVLAPDAVADAMRAADLLVLPSKGEGFPLVVQEALACGTPVLVSQAVAEAFPRRDEACVFAADVAGPDAAARLREALAALRDDRARVVRARAAAAALATQWSWAACAASYAQLYGDLADARRSLTM